MCVFLAGRHSFFLFRSFGVGVESWLEVRYESPGRVINVHSVFSLGLWLGELRLRRGFFSV